MTKMQKRIVMYMAAILILLALVCTCLVGNTFARFTSSDTGTASGEIAKWSLTSDNFGSSATTIEFDKLSPNQVAYGYDNTGAVVTDYSDATDDYVQVTADPNCYARYNSIGDVTVTITNNSDVDAYISLSSTLKTLTFGEDPNDTTYTIVESASSANEVESTDEVYDSQSSAMPNATDTEKAYTFGNVADLFQLTVSDAKQGVDAASLSAATYSNGYYTVEDGNIIQFTLTLSWISADSASTASDCTAADALDTFVGTYFTAVGFEVSYTAVQASELPSSV